MPVDLNKLRSGRPPPGGGYSIKDPDVEVLDRVHLRKNWKRGAGVTYWVELLFHVKEQRYQVRKSWRWFKGGSEGWVEGETWFGRPLTHPDDVAECYKGALESQFEKEYIIADHERDPASPIPEALPKHWETQMPRTVAAPPKPLEEALNDYEEILKEEYAVKCEEPTAPPVMRRKGEKDWW